MDNPNTIYMSLLGLFTLGGLFTLAFSNLVSSWPLLSRVAYAVVFGMSCLSFCSPQFFQPTFSFFLDSLSLSILLFSLFMYISEKASGLYYYRLDQETGMTYAVQNSRLVDR